LNNDEVGHSSDCSIMPLLMPVDASITVQTNCRTFVDVVCDVRMFVFSCAIGQLWSRVMLIVCSSFSNI